MNQALIVGIDSAIGNALFTLLTQAKWMVFGTTRRKEHVKENISYLDLKSIEDFHVPYAIDVVYLCGGMTKIAECQKNLIDAEAINVTAILKIADYFLNQRTHVVYLSSNAVFNGDRPAYQPQDLTCPNTVYGEHKNAVEKALLQYLPNVAIVRLTKVLTENYPLILQWIQALKRNETIRPYQNLKLCPISIHLVTHCLKMIGEKKLSGIIHLSGENDVTYLDIAQFLLNHLALRQSLIVPQDLIESALAFNHIPKHASLDMNESIPLFNLSQKDLAFHTTMNNLYKDVL